MSRFQVYETREGQLLVDCQAEILNHLDSRFVVPLMSPDRGLKSLARLNPFLTFDGQKLIFFTQYATSLPVKELGKPIGSLAESEYELSAALDMLLIGF